MAGLCGSGDCPVTGLVGKNIWFCCMNVASLGDSFGDVTTCCFVTVALCPSRSISSSDSSFTSCFWVCFVSAPDACCSLSARISCSKFHSAWSSTSCDMAESTAAIFSSHFSTCLSSKAGGSSKLLSAALSLPTDGGSTSWTFACALRCSSKSRTVVAAGRGGA